MNEMKMNLKGSEAKDEFKRWHKRQLPGSFYACDADLILLRKYPTAEPFAVLDYKTVTDTASFTEVILYNWFLKHNVQVFIVSTIPSLPPYTSVTIKKYLGGDWHPDPPTVKIEVLITGMPISEYIKWETKLRGVL